MVGVNYAAAAAAVMDNCPNPTLVQDPGLQPWPRLKFPDRDLQCDRCQWSIFGARFHSS